MKKNIILITSIICILGIGTFLMYWQKSSEARMRENKKNNTSIVNKDSSNTSLNAEGDSSSNSDTSTNTETDKDEEENIESPSSDLSTTNSNPNTSTNSSSSSSTNKTSSTNKPSTSSNSNVAKPLTVAEKVEQNLKEMTLDEKIGQMLIISVSGTTLTSTTKTTLTQYKPGGVILFANNLGNYNTTIKFISDMKSTNSIPLIVAVDQEGGSVQRLTSITGKAATNIPTMADLGKTEDENLAYSIGAVMAEELRVLGFNMDFAPVVDVAVSGAYISTRSFSTNASIVSKMAVSLSKGLESKGVVSVYKHFPGHGSTVVDSHYDLPLLSKTKAELYDVDLIPFQNAIQNDAKVIMIGHLAIPNITGDKTPASLSKTLITGLLKNELGYKGLVVTDALNMGALTSNYTEKQIYEMAINAGVDILLMPKSPQNAINYIKQSINEGKITESQINDSVRKILTLKYTTLKTDNLSTSYLGSTEHQNIVKKVYQ